MLAYAIGFPADSLILRGSREFCVPVTTEEWKERAAQFKIFCGDRPDLFPRFGQMTSWVVVGGSRLTRFLAWVRGTQATYASPRSQDEVDVILVNASNRYHY